MSADDERPLSSELTIRTRAGDEARLRDLPAPVMQALYHQITGRTETISQKESGDFKIELSAIRGLVERVEQTLLQFNYTGAKTVITIFHYKRDKVICSSLEKFLQYDTGRSDPISAINVEVDFLLSVPQVGQHQSYKISVDLTSYVQLADDKRANYGLRTYGAGKEPIEYTIHYIDYVVARSFKQTIDEWVESLSRLEIRKVPGWFDNAAYPISRIIASLSSLSCILLAISYFDLDRSLTSVSLVTLMAAFAVLSHSFQFALDQTFDLIGARSYFPFVLLNKGDDRNFEKFFSRRRTAQRFGGFLMMACLLPIIVNLFAAFLDRSIVQ